MVREGANYITEGGGGPEMETDFREAIRLKAFDGREGVEAAGGGVRIHRLGEEVASASDEELEEAVGGLAPCATADAFAWAAGVASLFPGEVFCFGGPVSAEFTVRISTDATGEDLALAGASVASFYDPTLFESFDGEITASALCPPISDGRGSFREWRRDVGNLAEFPAHYRRVVDLTLPPALSGHQEDLVLLHRLSEAVAELLGRYVESGGREVSYSPGRIDNLFAGGGLPLPRRVAPVLYGRAINDVYLRGGRG